MLDVKLLVLSDSHRTMCYMECAVLHERPDVILHLGDRQKDAWALSRIFPGLALLSVPGNCDFGAVDEKTRLAEYEGVRIFATHGHAYGVKNDLLRIQYTAQATGADVLVFGHTHRPLLSETDGLMILNPGAASGDRPSYGVVQISNGSVKCRIERVDMRRHDK